MRDFIEITETEIEEFVESKPQLKKLIGLSKKPFSLAIALLKNGFTSIKKNLLYVMAIFFVNFVIISYSFYRLLKNEISGSEILIFIIILSVGLIGIGFIVFRAYKMVILDFYLYLFQQFHPFVKKLTDFLIELTEDKTEENVDFKNIQVNIRHYVSQVPWMIRKPILFILKFIPVANLLTEVYESEDDLSTTEAKSDFLFEKINENVSEFIEDQNSSKWFLIILGISLAIQLYLLVFKMS